MHCLALIRLLFEIWISRHFVMLVRYKQLWSERECSYHKGLADESWVSLGIEMCRITDLAQLESGRMV